MTLNGNPLLNSRQASELCGIKYQTFLKWTREGKVPHTRFNQRVIRFDAEKLNAWKIKNTVVCDPDANQQQSQGS
mgnify:CR=1 FL=1